MSEAENNGSRNESAEKRSERKPYVAPQLRSLGTVHELSLGAAMTTIELPAGFKAM